MVFLACVDGEENAVPFRRAMLASLYNCVKSLQVKMKHKYNYEVRRNKPPAALYVPGACEGRNSLAKPFAFGWYCRTVVQAVENCRHARKGAEQ